MKYAIMCGGIYTNFVDLPKQFIKINGEPLVLRTIRLLQENGISKEDIVITSNNSIFEQCGVTVLKNSMNNFKQDAPWTNMKGWWLNALHPFTEPVCYLFGDVYYSEKAIKTIITTEVSTETLFGANPYWNKNGINMKPYPEPLAFKVLNNIKVKLAIKSVKQLAKQGMLKRHPIIWELYRYLNGYNLNQEIIGKNFICINDISTDLDTPEDATKIENYLKQYGPDLKK